MTNRKSFRLDMLCTSLKCIVHQTSAFVDPNDVITSSLGVCRSTFVFQICRPEGHFPALTDDEFIFCSRYWSPGQEIWSLMGKIKIFWILKNEHFCLKLNMKKKRSKNWPCTFWTDAICHILFCACIETYNLSYTMKLWKNHKCKSILIYSWTLG